MSKKITAAQVMHNKGHTRKPIYINKELLHKLITEDHDFDSPWGWGNSKDTKKILYKTISDNGLDPNDYVAKLEPQYIQNPNEVGGWKNGYYSFAEYLYQLMYALKKQTNEYYDKDPNNSDFFGEVAWRNTTPWAYAKSKSTKDILKTLDNYNISTIFPSPNDRYLAKLEENIISNNHYNEQNESVQKYNNQNEQKDPLDQNNSSEVNDQSSNDIQVNANNAVDYLNCVLDALEGLKSGFNKYKQYVVKKVSKTLLDKIKINDNTDDTAYTEYVIEYFIEDSDSDNQEIYIGDLQEALTEHINYINSTKKNLKYIYKIISWINNHDVLLVNAKLLNNMGIKSIMENEQCTYPILGDFYKEDYIKKLSDNLIKLSGDNNPNAEDIMVDID